MFYETNNNLTLQPSSGNLTFNVDSSKTHKESCYLGRHKLKRKSNDSFH